MTDAPTCPQCKKPLPANAPEGICPVCALEMAIASQPPTVTSPTPPGFIPPSPADLAACFKQLEIIELIGRGGMGAVYKARQPTLNRVVAVKILPPTGGDERAFAERFSREARALARLNHPNIVGIYDFGQTTGPDGRALYYFVMEYVQGVNLRQMIRSKLLTSAQALAIVPQVCEALQFAHDEGVVHRDIKPENVLIDKRGRVKIADFGLAKLAGPAGDDHTLTQEGAAMGTVHYMAPEQVTGAHNVDHRADIYSLGVVFYEMLTGELPLGRFAAPSTMVQIDVRLDEVVLRTLEREPEMRFQQAGEVKTKIESIGQTVAPPSEPQPKADTNFSKEFPIRVWCRDWIDAVTTFVATGWLVALFWIVPTVIVRLMTAMANMDPKHASSVAMMVGMLVFISAYLVLAAASVQNVRVDAEGLTMNRLIGPSKFLPWTTVRRVERMTRWEVFRHVWMWPGLPPRGSILSGTGVHYYRIDCQNDCWYFAPRQVEPFLAALKQIGHEAKAESSRSASSAAMIPPRS